jgi:hypothetical protein
MGGGLYRRGQAMREGEVFSSLIICDHKMERVYMPSWLRNWRFLRFCKRGNKPRSLANGHMSGVLVSVLALGLSACPKNDRNLTHQIMPHSNYGLRILDFRNTGVLDYFIL